MNPPHLEILFPEGEVMPSKLLQSHRAKRDLHSCSPLPLKGCPKYPVNPLILDSVPLSQ